MLASSATLLCRIEKLLVAVTGEMAVSAANIISPFTRVHKQTKSQKSWHFSPQKTLQEVDATTTPISSQSLVRKQFCSYLKEKMKGIGEGSMMMMNSTQATLKAAGADEMMNNLQGKLKQQFLMGENSGLFLAGWFDKIFPPEIRQEILHWLRVGATVVAAGVVLLVLLFCVIRCAGCIAVCIGHLFRCIGVCIVYFFRGIGLCLSYFFRCIGTCCGITMMRAPGLALWIPRCLFEAFPRAYFCALRAITALASALLSVGG